jgi:hypothetical protein
MDEFDFGDMSGLDFGDFDLSGLENMDLSGLADMDMSGIDFGDFDLSGLEGLEGLDLSGLEGMDLSSVDLGDLEGLNLDSAGGNTRSLFGGGESGYSPEDQQGLDDLMAKFSGEDVSGPLLTPDGVDESFTGNLSEDEYNRYLETLDSDYKSPLSDLPAQQMQITPGNQESFDKNLTDIMQNRGGFTSQWQKVGSDRVMVNDDGTGIGINENGDPYPLSAGQVNSMIKNGQLNTFASGYNTATGGNEKGPGGSMAGKSGTPGKDGSGNKSGTGEKKDDWMKYIMLLMALDAMRNKGGGSSGAVIPNLTAGRSTTPYAQVQNAPGYRPGQGGVQYFGPTVYRAAGGGIGALDAAGGRLLRGPGDGVSDDIVAQIGDNQPARLADGEYVLDARTVSEIGNGSTDAGADKIAEMVERIHSERRNAKRGEPSNADKKLLA